MKRSFFAMLAVLLSFAATATSASAATITNGSFETGTFSGWVVSDLGSGSWLINSSPTGTFQAMAPTDGTRSAYTQQGGPGSHVIYQDIVLEANEQHTLALDLGYRNNAGRFVTPASLVHNAGQNQQARVDILTPTAAVRSVAAADVLMNVLQTPVGSPTVRPMSSITADLSAFAGQTVRLRIAQVDNLGTFNLTVDKIRITSVSVDADGDGSPDNADNCPSVPNADQTDTDGDGQGDACDADDDGDGVADGDDAFPLDATESVDTDGDGIGNNADGDDDGDGVADGDDTSPLDPANARPKTKDACKNDGWKAFRVDGVTFKNQGDCVSYVATEGKNQPAGG